MRRLVPALRVLLFAGVVPGVLALAPARISAQSGTGGAQGGRGNAGTSRAPAPPPAPRRFTHADTLRGSNTPQRAWWDAVFYDLHVRVNPADSSISGWNGITYRVLASNAPAGRELQVDLQMPLVVDSMHQDGKAVTYRRDGNAFFAKVPPSSAIGALRTLTVWYHGVPVASA